VEASRVNLSERRLGRVARHGGLLVSDLCDCKCAFEIVSTKKRGETTVAGCAAFNNVAEERRLGQLKPGNKKDEQNRCAGGPWREYGSLA
jgi:hypothetical protein